jgi:hypothetical protein
MKIYEEMKVLLHAYLTLAFLAGEWSASRFDGFIPCDGAPVLLDMRLGGSEKKNGIHWIHDWLEARGELVWTR